MDLDSVGDSRLQQTLAKKRSGLDAINNLESKIVKKTADKERLDKEQRMQEKYLVCDSLPEDWTLKTELEISVPLMREVTEASEQILNHKDVQRQLNYFIYMETQLPKFLQENQNAEYLRNADKINWVMSFKDVYLKFVDSYQRLSSQRDAKIDDDDLEMPCFYLRNEASIALFRIDAETHAPIAELIPSHNLEKLIKESLGANVYTVQKIYEDDENLNNQESDLIAGKTRTKRGDPTT